MSFKASFMPLNGKVSALALAALTLWPAWSLAEKADRGKPMHVEADRLRFDEAKQVRVITGNVLITKGSIVIRGARVELRQDAAGNQYAKVIAEAGRRAFFRQKRDGLDEFIEGEGETIDYDGKADTVRFVGQAEMRRLRGVTLFDQMSGNLISYDNQTDVFSVDGAGASTGAATPGGGRIRLMLTPPPDAAAGAVPTGGAPLRSSPGLAQETK
jgi:lipopolysaccharide export system protein LptA